jgi:hypothetical protein
MRSLSLTAVATALCAVLAPAAASACDLCAVYAALEARESQPGLYAGAFEQYTDFSTVRAEGMESTLRSSITQVVVGYQWTRRFGLQANVPLIDRSYRRPENGEQAEGSESGLGDVALIGHLRLVESYRGDATFVWNVLGGVKLATGSSDRLGEEAGEEDHGGGDGHDDDHAAGAATAGSRLVPVTAAHGDEGHAAVHGHDLALGTGSTDALAGTNAFFRWRRWLASANLQYAARREGDFDYRYGDDLSWSLAPAYFALLREDSTLAFGAHLSGESKDDDEAAGAPVTGTGVRSVYAGPTVTYTRGKAVLAEAALDLPVSQDDPDSQVVPDRRLRLAFTWRW